MRFSSKYVALAYDYDSSEDFSWRNKWEGEDYGIVGLWDCGIVGLWDCGRGKELEPPPTRMASSGSCALRCGWIWTSLRPCASMGWHHPRIDHDLTAFSSIWLAFECPMLNPVG